MISQVVRIAVERRDQRPRLTPRPQSHINAIEESGPGLAIQSLDQPLADLPENLRLGVGEKNEIDVGTIIELFPAELSECQDGESAGGLLRSLRGQFQAGLNQPVGQQGQLNGDRAQVDNSKSIARPDAQQFPPLIASQSIQLSRLVGRILGAV